MKQFKLFLPLLFLFTTLCYGQSSVSLEPLKVSIRQATMDVSTTAVALPATALSGRKSIMIRNADASVILYIGGSDVTADTTSTGGLQLKAGEVYTGDLSDDIVIYGIAPSSIKVNILEAR